MILYNNHDASSCLRVRIALNWKGIDYEIKNLDLRRQGGLATLKDFERLSITKQVPVIVDGDFALSQSGAIIEYLEESYPQPSLMPDSPRMRARVREFCQLIACDIHPLGTLRVRKYLSIHMGVNAKDKDKWLRHWLAEGLKIMESKLDGSGGYCFSGQLTKADLFLIAKLHKARLMNLDLKPYPRLLEVEEHCLQLPAVQKALQSNDSEED